MAFGKMTQAAARRSRGRTPDHCPALGINCKAGKWGGLARSPSRLLLRVVAVAQEGRQPGHGRRAEEEGGTGSVFLNLTSVVPKVDRADPGAGQFRYLRHILHAAIGPARRQSKAKDEEEVHSEQL